MNVTRDMGVDRLRRLLELIEHHLVVLEHSPCELDETIASIRIAVGGMKDSLRARDSIVTTPYTRKTVYTISSDRPLSVIKRRVTGDTSHSTARRCLTVVPLEKAAL